MAPMFVFVWKALAKRKIELFTTTKIAIGISFAALAFVALYFSSYTSTSNNYFISLAWLLLANILLGSGEICFIPSVLSCINKYSPDSLQSTMMGTWFLFIAFGGYLAGQLSKLSDYNLLNVSKLISSHVYGDAFLKIAMFTLVAALLIYAITPFARSLTK